VAVLLFAASLLGSRVFGAPLATLPVQLGDLLRTLLDLQFGLALAVLLLAWGKKPGRSGIASARLARLNRRFPAANPVMFACHFPFMMFIVGAASRVLAMPIAGQPGPLAFLVFGAAVCLIYAYALLMSQLAARLVRLLPAARRRPGVVAAADVAT
jgi:hypothetical protein